MDDMATLKKLTFGIVFLLLGLHLNAQSDKAASAPEKIGAAEVNAMQEESKKVEYTNYSIIEVGSSVVVEQAQPSKEGMLFQNDKRTTQGKISYLSPVGEPVKQEDKQLVADPTLGTN